MILIGDLINMVRSGIPKDHPLNKNTSDRTIYNVLVSLRSRLLTQELEKNKKVSDWNYTVLNCVEIIEVPKIQCPCLKHLSCETIYRTKYKVPKPFQVSGKKEFTWIKTLLGEEISIVEQETVEYLSGNRYSSQESDIAILENGYFYFYKKDMPKIIRLKFLAYDLSEVDTFKEYCQENEDCTEPCLECEENSENLKTTQNTGCLSMYEREFVIDEDLVDVLVSLAKLRLFFRKTDFDTGQKQQKQQSNES